MTPEHPSFSFHGPRPRRENDTDEIQAFSGDANLKRPPWLKLNLPGVARKFARAGSPSEEDTYDSSTLERWSVETADFDIRRRRSQLELGKELGDAAIGDLLE